MVGIDLSRADLTGAVLAHANLRDGILEQTRLVGASLRCTYLRGARMQGADLRGADLRGANLTGANLSQASLRGVRLTTRAEMDEVKRQKPNFKGLGTNMAEVARRIGDDPRDVIMDWQRRMQSLRVRMDRTTIMPNGRRYGWFNCLRTYAR